MYSSEIYNSSIQPNGVSDHSKKICFLEVKCKISTAKSHLLSIKIPITEMKRVVIANNEIEWLQNNAELILEIKKIETHVRIIHQNLQQSQSAFP